MDKPAGPVAYVRLTYAVAEMGEPHDQERGTSQAETGKPQYGIPLAPLNNGALRLHASQGEDLHLYRRATAHPS